MLNPMTRNSKMTDLAIIAMGNKLSSFQKWGNEMGVGQFGWFKK